MGEMEKAIMYNIYGINLKIDQTVKSLLRLRKKKKCYHNFLFNEK